MNELRDRFRALHTEGLFVMPNAWDVGSARLLASTGFHAIATTSSGHAASLGKGDMQVTRDELLSHVEALAASVSIPLSVDAERCFADDPDGVAETVDLIAAAGRPAVRSRTSTRPRIRSMRSRSPPSEWRPRAMPRDSTGSS